MCSCHSFAEPRKKTMLKEVFIFFYLVPCETYVFTLLELYSCKDESTRLNNGFAAFYYLVAFVPTIFARHVTWVSSRSSSTLRWWRSSVLLMIQIPGVTAEFYVVIAASVELWHGGQRHSLLIRLFFSQKRKRKERERDKNRRSPPREWA